MIEPRIVFAWFIGGCIGNVLVQVLHYILNKERFSFLYLITDGIIITGVLALVSSFIKLVL